MARAISVLDNARFWVWHRGGWVKLTLRSGRQLRTVEGGPHEEGFSHEFTEYTHEGDAVRREWHEHGRDCDGRYQRGGESICVIENLRARDVGGPDMPSENAGILAPEWTPVEEYQRDHTAEAAGY